MGKAQTLAKIEGFDDALALAEAYAIDSVTPGICTNEDCDYTTNVEPDSSTGWCECCETNTVKSIMEFALEGDI